MTEFAPRDALSASAPARAALATYTVAIALALLLGLQPVLTDLYLPALPLLARDLAAPMSAAQLTMSALILAFGLSQLVWGPVADRFGRRPVLLGSLALLVLAGVGAAMASHIGWLIFWRIAQGATLAAAVVCARAMVRDLYEPLQGAQVMSLGLSGLGLLAIGSPLVGGALAMTLGWRSTLAAVACFSLLVLVFVWRVLPETLVQRNPTALHGPAIRCRCCRTRRFEPGRCWSRPPTVASSPCSPPRRSPISTYSA
jgi:DHA1 family bicyclomycin/chloramphenicol resistance-like MFS transporter